MKLFNVNLLCLLFVGCSSFHKGDVQSSFYLDPIEDKSYYLAVRKYSRIQKLYSGFETLYFINISYFSEDFLDSFKKRKSRIFSENVELFSYTKNQQVFFISLFGPNDDLIDIEDRQEWSIYIKQGDKQIYPESIKKAPKKGVWDTFFPYINHWSKEFFIVFNEEINPQDNLVLVIGSTQAKTVIEW